MVGLLEREGLGDVVEVASAGTGGWHVGDPPDARSAAAAARRGITLRGTAQQVRPTDFEDYDLFVAMDASNRRDLLALAGEHRDKVVLLRELDPEAVAVGDTDVPDPYYGGPHGFDTVLDVVEAGCAGLLRELRERGLV